MTDGQPAFNRISVLHSMLDRLKSSDRLQGSSQFTTQQGKSSKDKNKCETVSVPESDKPPWNFAQANPPELPVKPKKKKNDANVNSEYFTQRTDYQESDSTSNTFLKSRPPSNVLHHVVGDTQQNLQPDESNRLWEEVKEEQMSQTESNFSVLNSSPAFSYNPTGSFLSNSEPVFVKGTTTPLEYDIMKQPLRNEYTVTSMKRAKPPPLPPKVQNLNKVHVQLQRNFSFKDFKLNLEPINLLDEICVGEEWEKYLPVKNSPPQTDTRDYSETEDSDYSDDDIGCQNAVIEPDLSDNEQPEIRSYSAGITDIQVDRIIEVRQETSDSDVSALPDTKITQRTFDLHEYQQIKDEENNLVVVTAEDKLDKKDKTMVKDMVLDLSVVQSSGVLDNSALKSRINLSKKRKHRPPGKRKKGNIIMDFTQKQRGSTDSRDSSRVSAIAQSKFYYALPNSEFNDSQTAVLGNEMAQIRNDAERQRISNIQESYSNDNNYQLSDEAAFMGEPLDFSVVQSSGVLDNSALKSRIQLSKKRKHRPPGKIKNENSRTKFFNLSFIHQRNTSSKFFQSSPSQPSVSTSETNNFPRSYESDHSQTHVSGNEKQQKTKDRALKSKLWKMKT